MTREDHTDKISRSYGGPSGFQNQDVELYIAIAFNGSIVLIVTLGELRAKAIIYNM